MNKKRSKPAATVASFLETLEHPLKTEIVLLRSVLLNADPTITEEVKWNAPSFRTSEHFATMHLRGENSLLLILHLGANSKKVVPPGAISDPNGLLKWLGPDRAAITFEGVGDVTHKEGATVGIIRQWINYV